MKIQTRINVLVLAVMLVASLIPQGAVMAQQMLSMEEEAIYRGQDADAERWQALGERFLEQEEQPKLLSGLEAEAAGYSAFYGEPTERGRDVDSARWSTMGRFYQEQKLLAGLEAEAAGYSVFYLERFLADRPELSGFGVDAAAEYGAYLDSFLAENPELSTFLRWGTCGC